MDMGRQCDQTASQLKRSLGMSTILFEEKGLLHRERAALDILASRQHRLDMNHRRFDRNVRCFSPALPPTHTKTLHTAARAWTANAARKDHHVFLAATFQIHCATSSNRCSGPRSSRHHILRQKRRENLSKIEHKICEDSYLDHRLLPRTCLHTIEGVMALQIDP